ncbi:MAG: EAL domain-containing protein [Burkholderiaceae bacterium]|nr:EAL domain-containing protein [Burkholderiaceae bacterium]
MSTQPATPRTGPKAPAAGAPTAPLALLDAAALPSPLSDAAEAQRVGDIMTLHLRQMDVATTLAHAAQEMAQARVSSLIITRHKLPVGILTERDMLRLLATHTPTDTTVAVVMSTPLCTAGPEERFGDVWSRMVSRGLRHLVITAPNGTALGLVSETDFRNHTDRHLLAELGDLSDLVERDLCVLDPDTPLAEGVQLMLQQRSTYVLVARKRKALGILTERDIPRLMTLPNASERALGELATAVLHTVAESVWMMEAAMLMQRLEVRHLVVVDANGLLVGMVQTHRIMTRLGEHLQQRHIHQERQALQQRSQFAEQRLMLAGEAGHMGFWEVDLLTGAMTLSGYTNTLVGMELPEGLSTFRDFGQLVVEQDRHLLSGLFARAREPGHQPVMDVEYRIRRASDGTLRCLHSVGQATQPDEAGLPTRALGVTTDITERKLQQAQLDDTLTLLRQRQAELEHLSRTINRSPVVAMTWATTPGWPICYVSTNITQWGYSAAELKAQHTPYESLIHPDDLAEVNREIDHFLTEHHDQFDQSYRLRAADGRWLLVQDHTWVERDAQGRVERVHGVLTDITERNWLEHISRIEREVLADLARGSDLPSLLSQLARHHEALMPGVLASVLLLGQSGQTLHTGAAPSLPPDFVQAVNGVSIGPEVGSCGTAAFTGRTVVVSDIATDPLWANYKDLAKAHGLAACWSVPIKDGQGSVLGTFAMYTLQPQAPTAAQVAAIERGATLAGLVIERDRNQDMLRKLSLAVEQSPNSIVITNLNAEIEYANQSFFSNSGYAASEVLGRNPRLLQSGKTPANTYQQMWGTLTAGMPWKGEFTNLRKDGSEYIESVRISPVQQANGQVTHYLAIKEDITRQKLAEQQIYRLAYFDVLTGLPNRQLLTDRFQQAVNISRRQGAPLALMFIDLDHFKHINDTLGHSAGDELLVQVARRLESLVRAGDTLSRQGGDEFVLVLPGCGADEARGVAHKLVEHNTRSFTVGGHDMVVTLSVGIALFPTDGADFEALSKSADVAMYRAKEEGRNTFRFFTPDMQSRSGRTLMLENSLRTAMDRGELELVYQPQTSLANGALVGVEALLRWRHPELGMVSPVEFIPMAESSGQILRIGEWVLRTAARQVKQWMDEGLDAITLAVNLSAVQFRDPGLAAMVARVLHDTGLPPTCLELELTESAAMGDPLGAVVAMDEISALRVAMSIDDFGTGYSSLSYLKRFKVAKLKIDQSFVRDITTDPDDKAIVGAIIGLASNLGLRTIAEGVETPGQLAWLRLQGCDEAQGYFFSPPLSPTNLLTWVREQGLQPGQLPHP